MRKILTTLLIICLTATVSAQSLLPQQDGARERYDIEIDFGKACLSGVCLLLNEGGDNVKGSIVNEFGVNYIDFSYSLPKDKVRLHSVAGPADKWYIRLALKRYLRRLLRAMKQGEKAWGDGRVRMTVKPDGK